VTFLLLDKVDTFVYTICEVIILETAKLFTSGGSQAVRLPKSCRFNGDEVAVKKVGSIVMLFTKDDALNNFLASEPLTNDVYESILSARREDAEYAAAHAEDREKVL
jgi:antitoxin VapB